MTAGYNARLLQGVIAIYLFLINYLENRAVNNGCSETFMKIIRRIQCVHNIGLSMFSLVMVGSVGYLSVMFLLGRYPDEPDSYRGDFLNCSRVSAPSTGRLWYWVYIFYLTKYWELLDTILQVRLTFLCEMSSDV